MQRLEICGPKRLKNRENGINSSAETEMAHLSIEHRENNFFLKTRKFIKLVNFDL
jgi:hypothetical protein